MYRQDQIELITGITNAILDTEDDVLNSILVSAMTSKAAQGQLDQLIYVLACVVNRYAAILEMDKGVKLKKDLLARDFAQDMYRGVLECMASKKFRDDMEKTQVLNNGNDILKGKNNGE